MDQPTRRAHGAGAHRCAGNLHRPVRCLFHHPDLLALRNPAVEGEAGWTFVEVLVVIAIILVLTSAVGFMAFRYIGKARQVTAKDQIETLSLALNAYALDCARHPSAEQGLEALWVKPILEPMPAGWDGPYVTRKIAADPWGHRYEYTVPGPQGLPFGIRSYGADGKEGGEGEDTDIASWQD